MPAHDTIKQIVARPHREGRGSLEITMESGAVIEKDIPFDPLMKAIADLIKYEAALKSKPQPAAAEISSPS